VRYKSELKLLNRILILIFTPVLISEYAIAEEGCPDDQRAAYSRSDYSTQSDFWIIPFNHKGSYDPMKSFPTLISRYTGVTKPLFSCFHGQNFYNQNDGGGNTDKMIWCSTNDGRSFGGNTWPTIIPNKSGGFSKIDIVGRSSTYVRVSCKSRIYENYQIIRFIEDIPGASRQKPLPYLIISREKYGIQVSDYGKSPQF